jgi:hypothetical protein
MKEEGVRTKDSDIYVAVLADIRIISIGAMGEDGNRTETESAARIDSVADRSDGIIAALFLGLPRRLCPLAELRFPVSQQFRSPKVYASIAADC